jgi:hypothetical protein
MKKLIIFLILFIVPIPAFTQDKSLLQDNFSLIKHSRDNIPSFFNLDIASPVNHLFDSEKKNHSKQYQIFQVPKARQFSELIYFSERSVIEGKKQNWEKPPLRVGRILGEILAGGALGLALGYGGAYLGYLIAGGEDEGLEWASGLIIGGSLGATIGTALGVYTVGCIGDETGSLGATFLGSILGVGLGWVALLVGEESILTYISIAIPPISACVGFNMTRRYKFSSSSGRALLNFREGQMSLGIPMVYFRPDTFGRRAINLNASFMNVEF